MNGDQGFLCSNDERKERVAMAHHTWLCLGLLGCSTATGDAPDGAIVVGDADVHDASGAPDGSVAPDASPGAGLRVYGDDYGDGVVYAPFGGSSNGPSISGVDPHGGTAALQIEVPAAGYTGGAFRVTAPADLSGYTAVTFWARASRAATLNVVGIGNDAATTTYWAEHNGVPLTTTWTRHVIPLPDPSVLTAEHGLFHVAEGSDEGVYTLWLDDIQYELAPPEPITAPSPAIATESISLAVAAHHLINGVSVTYQIGGAPHTVAMSRRYFTYSSSQPAVATVDAEGRVTAVAAGTTTITARFGSIDAIGALTLTVHP
jgi:hypothetical protein